MSASHHRAPHILEAAPIIVQIAPMGKAAWVSTETSHAQLWIAVVVSYTQCAEGSTCLPVNFLKLDMGLSTSPTLSSRLQVITD